MQLAKEEKTALSLTTSALASNRNQIGYNIVWFDNLRHAGV